MKKLPSDISPDFKDSWEAFNELPQTRKLDPIVLAECFRIFLMQAGVRQKMQRSIKDFFTVNTQYNVLRRVLTTRYLLDKLLPVKHQFAIDIEHDDLINVVNGFVMRGQVKLKPQRFELKYLLERLVSLRVFKSLPSQLSNPKPVGSMQRLKPSDFALVYRDSNIALHIALLKGGFLVLDYSVRFDVVMPMYPNIDKQLVAIWRRATIGDFR